MLRIYIIGLCILLIAIIFNVVVGKLGISTWYDFGPQFFKRGLIVMKEVGVLSSVWLFILLRANIIIVVIVSSLSKQIINLIS